MSIPIQPEKLDRLQEGLGYHFSDLGFLINALTHSSYAYESKKSDTEDNERLEFLGDGILDFVVAEELFHRKTKRDEGYLSKTRSLIVCEAMLSDIAKNYNIGDLLLLGRGEDASGGRTKPSNLSNAMEAIFASVYLDGGYEAAKNVILSVLSGPIDLALTGSLVFDYKSKLLEWAQSRHVPLSFVILEENGPVHRRIYKAAVLKDNDVLSEGIGRSKKIAEQEAAKSAYMNIQKAD
ncbi:MAG: ribonuclease III [Clostridiales bacterium]|nr:ribonuclease III [Clostridiales bacterium]